MFQIMAKQDMTPGSKGTVLSLKCTLYT